MSTNFEKKIRKIKFEKQDDILLLYNIIKCKECKESKGCRKELTNGRSGASS